jgi:ketopantoate reductase
MDDREYHTQQQRIHAAMPADLQNIYRDAPRNDDRLRQVAWLAKTIRPTVQDHIVTCIFDQPEHDAEVVKAAVAFTSRLAWPHHVADAAIASEKRIATASITALLDRIEKRVRTLAYERAQGARIIREAQAIADESGIFVPSSLVLQTVKRVAQAAAGGNRARRG